MSRLFEVPGAQRRGPPATLCTALVPLPPGLCPDCHQPLTPTHSETSALFYMHGHGYRVRTTWASCPCGYRRHAATTAHNPRERME